MLEKRTSLFPLKDVPAYLLKMGQDHLVCHQSDLATYTAYYINNLQRSNYIYQLINKSIEILIKN